MSKATAPQPPKKVQDHLRRKVDRAPETVDRDDAGYVLKKFSAIEDKLRGTKAGEWILLLIQRARLLYLMIRSWYEGEYEPTAWRLIAFAVISLLYLVNPWDLIPDFIPIVGWADDFFVIAYAFSLLDGEIDRFVNECEVDVSEFDLIYEPAE